MITPNARRLRRAPWAALGLLGGLLGLPRGTVADNLGWAADMAAGKTTVCKQKSRRRLRSQRPSARTPRTQRRRRARPCA